VRFSGGYVTLGRWAGARVRAHWSLPIGAFVFGQLRFVPGFWLGFFLIILIHEMGHAAIVRLCRYRVVSIDVHGLGGQCCWDGQITSFNEALIAWGGVWAQALAFAAALGAVALLGPPETAFGAELLSAFTFSNLWLMALNLIPAPPLDGARAWRLPRLWLERRRLRVRRRPAPTPPDPRAAVARELQRLDASDRLSRPDTAAAVDAALRKLANGSADPKKLH
jgi:Zn-dependent protease